MPILQDKGLDIEFDVCHPLEGFVFNINYTVDWKGNAIT